MFGADTGDILDDTGNLIGNLVAGGLYFGGGQDGVPLPARIPGGATTFTAITDCDPETGDITIGPRTQEDTGSIRNCSDTGCFFGPPLPIPNLNAVATSTCVQNIISASADGRGSCLDGSVTNLSLPLASGIYLTGDLVAELPGIQPCPVCVNNTCEGGPNDGQSCTPETNTSGEPYPTSQDCPPPGANFLGALPIGFNLSTGTQTDVAEDLPGQLNVFCGFCATNAGVFQGQATRGPAVPCTSDAQCTTSPFTRCRQRSPGAFGTDLTTGFTARTITESGSEAGMCIAEGQHEQTLVSIFCIPPTFNGIVDGSADLPGPGAVALPGITELLDHPPL